MGLVKMTSYEQIMSAERDLRENDTTQKHLKSLVLFVFSPISHYFAHSPVPWSLTGVQAPMPSLIYYVTDRAAAFSCNTQHTILLPVNLVSLHPSFPLPAPSFHCFIFSLSLYYSSSCLFFVPTHSHAFLLFFSVHFLFSLS